MLYNLRAPGGAGKSWVVHELMRRFGFIQKNDNVFIESIGLIIAGRYAGLRGGGCDNMNGPDIEFLIRDLNKLIHMPDTPPWRLLFEAGCVSKTWKRWVNLSKEIDIQFLVLNTPFDVCRERRFARCGLPYNENEIIQFQMSIKHFDYKIVDWKNPIESLMGIMDGKEY